jgi:hypothetical protein
MSFSSFKGDNGYVPGTFIPSIEDSSSPDYMDQYLILIQYQLFLFSYCQNLWPQYVIFV